MPSDDQGILRIFGNGDVSALRVSEYLRSTVAAYESLVAFEIVIGQYARIWRDFDMYGSSPIPLSRRAIWATLLSPFGLAVPIPEAVHAVVAPRHRLRIHAVTLSSPGFWDFLGKLNPLEVMRQYLSDRHERRKDREYREEAEKERLHLENQLLENRVIRERIQMAKELGATDEDMTPLINELVGKPLSRLALYQDQNMIEGAELIPTKQLSE